VPGPAYSSVWSATDTHLPLAGVYRDWPISEDSEGHVRALQKLADGGVTHIFVHSPQADQSKGIRFYGEHVLPRFH
jgi:hypothetical protein